MLHIMLIDQHWQKVKAILRNLSIHHNSNLRNFIKVILLYRIRIGYPWRNLPRSFSQHNSVYKCFNHWVSTGKLIRSLKLLASYPDLEWIFLDGSQICAHQHSAGLTNQFF